MHATSSLDAFGPSIRSVRLPIALASAAVLLALLGGRPARAEVDPCANAVRCSVEEGWIQGPTGPMWVTYRLADGVAIYQEDIEVTVLGRDPSSPPPIEPTELREQESSSGGITLTQPLTFDTRTWTFWPGGRIPFAIANGFTAQMLNNIQTAIQNWNNNTPLQLVQAAPGDADVVTFTPVASGCRSPVGRQGGAQAIRLANCSAGSVMHEIGHAFGLWHEQSRHDRDAFVEILWDNIQSGEDDNFEKYDDGEGRDWGSYDYGSIMHYRSTAFGITQSDGTTATTIEAKRPLPPGVQMGQRTGLSRLDVVGSTARYFPIRGMVETGDRFGGAVARGDFDGDGFQDLAIGDPGEAVGSASGAGAVNVLYGTASGLSGWRNELWTQASSRVGGGAEAGDGFGSSLAAGDFDRDGYTDLAIGVPNEDIACITDAGFVNILYGSPSGLRGRDTSTGPLTFLCLGIHNLSVGWHQDSAGVDGAIEVGDHFGASLAAGDFDRDGFGDLVIGVPDEDIGSTANAGMVNVLRGSSYGLSASFFPANAFRRSWHQDSSGVPGAAEASDRFGASLSVGDFSGDGCDDLAVGVPGESIATGLTIAAQAGLVSVFYGTDAGQCGALPPGAWDQRFIPAMRAGAGDRFGTSLAAGDFDGDGFEDLAIGVPGESIGAIAAAGRVNFLNGSRNGVTSVDSRGTTWTLDQAGAGEVPQSSDQFGASLAAGDLNGDGLADLAVGVPNEDLNGTIDAGMIHVALGSPRGPNRGLAPQALSQASLYVGGRPEAYDRFGTSLATGDFDGDGLDDLAVGIPLEDVGSIPFLGINAGAVQVFDGDNGNQAVGIASWPNIIWHQGM